MELRLNADAKRIAAMRAAIRRECERSGAAPAHAAEILLVILGLVDDGEPNPGSRWFAAGRRSGVFVVVTVQSDATMLMVRDARHDCGDLGDRRQRVLEAHTSGWSTMTGPDGRTIWAEIPRVSECAPVVIRVEPPPEPVPVTAVPAHVVPTRALSRTTQ